jgi:predicted RND superfamily exporter protein
VSEFEAKFAHWVILYRWWIIPGTILIMLAAAAGTQHLYFDSSYRTYFGPGNPQRVAFEELENTYVKNDNLMIAMTPPNGQVFTRGEPSHPCGNYRARLANTLLQPR